jgi:hypothetical protein
MWLWSMVNSMGNEKQKRTETVLFLNSPCYNQRNFKKYPILRAIFKAADFRQVSNYFFLAWLLTHLVANDGNSPKRRNKSAPAVVTV